MAKLKNLAIACALGVVPAVCTAQVAQNPPPVHITPDVMEKLQGVVGAESKAPPPPPTSSKSHAKKKNPRDRQQQFTQEQQAKQAQQQQATIQAITKQKQQQTRP